MWFGECVNENRARWFGTPRPRLVESNVGLWTMGAGLVAILNSPTVLTFD
jgi:hypothetical protein